MLGALSVISSGHKDLLEVTAGVSTDLSRSLGVAVASDVFPVPPTRSCHRSILPLRCLQVVARERCRRARLSAHLRIAMPDHCWNPCAFLLDIPPHVRNGPVGIIFRAPCQVGGSRGTSPRCPLYWPASLVPLFGRSRGPTSNDHKMHAAMGHSVRSSENTQHDRSILRPTFGAECGRRQNERRLSYAWGTCERRQSVISPPNREQGRPRQRAGGRKLFDTDAT